MERSCDFKIPASEATPIARKLCQFLKPYVEKLIVAGSLRRRRPVVSDIEIIFIPKFVAESDPVDFFGHKIQVNIAERAIAALLKVGIIGRRPGETGIFSWGEKNKFAVHVESGIAIDFFSADQSNRFNYLVCRTGGAASNIAICQGAIARGWKWNPYGPGFTRENPRLEMHHVSSEREVFDFAGLQYLEPWERQ